MPERRFSHFFLFAFILCTSALFAQNAPDPNSSQPFGPPRPGTLKGVVTNGTTGKPAAGDSVTLLKLMSGMEVEADTTTNSQGAFSFQLKDLTELHVIRVKHAGVEYHQAVKPGSETVQVEVFDSSPRVNGITVDERAMMVREAHNGTLVMNESFVLKNAATPPVSTVNDYHFDFYLPEGAKVTGGEITAPRGRPTLRPPIPQQEKNKYSFVYPLRPGETILDVEYTLPYSGQIKLEPRLNIPVSRFFVALPKSVSFVPGDGTQYVKADRPDDPESKVMDVYGIVNPAPGQNAAFSVSGSGVMTAPPDAASTTAGDDSRPGGGLGVPNAQPNPLHSGEWVFLGVLLLFLAGGAAYIYASNRGTSQPASQPRPAQGGPSLLDVMKEELFQLESDRLQGKISPEEYQSTKAALDKTLERAMKRKAGT